MKILKVLDSFKYKCKKLKEAFSCRGRDTGVSASIFLWLLCMLRILDLLPKLQVYDPRSGSRPSTSRPEPRVSTSAPSGSHRPSSSRPAEPPVSQPVAEEAYHPVMEDARHSTFSLDPQEMYRASVSSQPFFEDLTRMPEYSFTDLLGVPAPQSSSQYAGVSQSVPSQFSSSSAQQTPSSTEFFLSLGFTPDPGTGGSSSHM